MSLCLVFIVLMSSDDLQAFIYVTKRLQMLNGQYVFLTTSLTLDSTYWSSAKTLYDLDTSDINGQYIMDISKIPEPLKSV